MRYIDAEKLKAEIERRIELLENGTGNPEVMKRVEGIQKGYNSILSFIDSLQQEQPEAIGGVVYHAMNVHWIVVNQEQLQVCLKQFPEGTEVEVLINARKEEIK